MLNYEIIKAFANNLENDQAPVLDEHREIERTAYDEGRHVYSVHFEVSLSGTVTTKIHVQWGLMEQLFLNKDRAVRWSSDCADALHIYLRLANEPDVEYTTVLFKEDVQRLWERIHSSNSPYPEDLSIVGVWRKLYERGVWEM